MGWGPLQRRRTAGGIALHRSGAGPLLVLLHGVGLRLEAWRRQIDALNPGFTVLALDLPGHGQSERLRQPSPTLADYTDAIASVVRAFDEPALVAGHSFGAMIALDLAARHPSLIRGVAALCAVHRRTEAARSAVLARASALAADPEVDPAASVARWFGPEPADPGAAAACRSWLRQADRSGYAAAYGVFAAEDGPPDAVLRRLGCPALFLAGANDPNSTPEMSRAMADLAPGGRAVIVEGAGHMAPMTHSRPVDAALAALAADTGG